MKKITEVPKLEGVYCIRNIINDKIYIGSSSNLHKRFQAHNKGEVLKMFEGQILKKAYQKYDTSDFEFQVIMITPDYKQWEALLIKLLKPDYNTAQMTEEGKLQPNLGKKFSKEWSEKLGKCKQHSKETLEILTKLNKENACIIEAFKDDILVDFTSWVEAIEFFNTSRGCLSKTKIAEGIYKWKGWTIQAIKKQMKAVEATRNGITMYFKSSYECDKHFNLWRGCTSNAILNNRGVYSDIKLSYKI